MRFASVIFLFITVFFSSSCYAPASRQVGVKYVYPTSSKALQRCKASEALAYQMGREYNVELDLIMGVIRVESNFRDKITSHAGARGLMQVMPSTGRYFKCGVLFDAQDNVRCGVRILRKLLDRYDGNKVYALGAYNGGSGYIRKALRKKMVPPNLGYAEKVLRGRSRYRNKGCEGLIRRLK